MRLPLTRRALLATALSALATKGAAAPRPYALVPERSEVAFRFWLNGTAQTGTVPVRSADIEVDPANLSASRAEVTADVGKARTGLIFVTQALLSASVLDAGNHPIVRFRSTRIRLGAKGRISEGARIEGDLTLRGVTRPISLNAVLSRPSGSAPDDLSVLFVDLDGQLSRASFGASGYPDLVADTVELDIHAEIRAI